jgi:class 3 adenylate cyclase
VWGRPVNLAKRLCDMAGPGEIKVGPAAFARAGHMLSTARPVRLRVKGITSAVVAHRVLGAGAARVAAGGYRLGLP